MTTIVNSTNNAQIGNLNNTGAGLTLPWTPVVGNWLAIGVLRGSVSFSGGPATDQLGNSYPFIVQKLDNGGNSYVGWWVGQITNAGVPVLKGSVGVTTIAAVSELSGTSGVSQNVVGAAGNSTNYNCSTTSYTTTNEDLALVVASNQLTAAPSIAFAAPDTLICEYTATSDRIMGYRSIGSAGTYSDTVNVTTSVAEQTNIASVIFAPAATNSARLRRRAMPRGIVRGSR